MNYRMNELEYKFLLTILDKNSCLIETGSNSKARYIKTRVSSIITGLGIRKEICIGATGGDVIGWMPAYYGVFRVNQRILKEARASSLFFSLRDLEKDKLTLSKKLTILELPSQRQQREKSLFSPPFTEKTVKYVKDRFKAGKMSKETYELAMKKILEEGGAKDEKPSK